MQLSCLDPLYTFVAGEFKGEALCAYDHCHDINENITVYCFTREVEVFVRLNEECRHFDLLLL
jgi:hypothetical protein